MSFLSKKNKREQAYQDYLKGMKYSEIAEKYGVTLNTVKSWKSRQKWTRENEGKCTQKKVCKKKSVQTQKSVQKKKSQKEIEYERIKANLLDQLKAKDRYEEVYIDLVNDYMAMWKIKNDLIEDINSRGVRIETFNSKGQVILKKNDNISEVPKYNSQMMKLLADLGLSAADFESGDDDDL